MEWRSAHIKAIDATSTGLSDISRAGHMALQHPHLPCYLPFMAIRIAAVLMASLAIASLSGVGPAMAAPAITVSPDSGPQGAPFTITGRDFQPDDKIYISIDTPQGVEGYPVAVVTTDANGEFVAHTFVGNVYPGPEFPDTAPPGGGQDVTLVPMEWVILAYPESFGGRTFETLAAAPRARFTVTSSSLPDTGGPPASSDSPLAQIATGLILLSAGLSSAAKHGLREPDPGGLSGVLSLRTVEST